MDSKYKAIITTPSYKSMCVCYYDGVCWLSMLADMAKRFGMKFYAYNGDDMIAATDFSDLERMINCVQEVDE